MPRNCVIIKVPPRKDSATPMADTLTSIRCPGLAKGGISAVTITDAKFSTLTSFFAFCAAKVAI